MRSPPSCGAAIEAISPEQPRAALPAQRADRREGHFRALFGEPGLAPPVLALVVARVHAPSARWLSERIGFAPGMAAMLSRLGERAPAVRERYVQSLQDAI